MLHSSSNAKVVQERTNKFQAILDYVCMWVEDCEPVADLLGFAEALEEFQAQQILRSTQQERARLDLEENLNAEFSALQPVFCQAMQKIQAAHKEELAAIVEEKADRADRRQMVAATVEKLRKYERLEMRALQDNDTDDLTTVAGPPRAKGAMQCVSWKERGQCDVFDQSGEDCAFDHPAKKCTVPACTQTPAARRIANSGNRSRLARADKQGTQPEAATTARSRVTTTNSTALTVVIDHVQL